MTEWCDHLDRFTMTYNFDLAELKKEVEEKMLREPILGIVHDICKETAAKCHRRFVERFI